MSGSIDPTLRHLNDCGCCEGISAETPVKVENRPGLPAIGYRVGTHAQFKETLLARLAGSKQTALSKLTTRDDDDFSIALLDAWATIADVLTFYQERIANEAYLRTATERLSVLELVRLIDYQLRPGVAANTYLAFVLEDAPGALGQALSLGTTAQLAPEPLPPIMIDIGTKVQSIPGPGEQAQTFETIEKIEARAEWNAIKPRLTQPQKLFGNMGSVVLQSTATNLKRGDAVLIAVDASTRVVRTVLNVTVNDEAKTTRIDFENPGLSPDIKPSPSPGQISDFPAKVNLDDTVIQKIVSKIWKEQDLSALIKIQGWKVGELVAAISKQTKSAPLTGNNGVFAFRQRAAIFGHNAPKWDSLPSDLRFPKRIKKYKADGTFEKFEIVPAAYPSSWEIRTLADDAQTSGNQHSIYLDNVYPGIVKDDWLVMASPSVPAPTATLVQVFEIKANVETSRSDFAISAKVSRLRVEFSPPFNTGLADFKMRTTTVYGQSEKLPVADVPIEDVVKDNTVFLDGVYLGLKIGQKVVLTGERSNLKGVIASETLTLKEVLVREGFTVLTFDQTLAYEYVRKSVLINANVALSTHGETVQEIIGGGDGTQSFQRFTLRQPPLTYTSASTPSGGQTTLEVRVKEILWHETSSFYSHGPNEHIYVTRLDDNGRTTVIFGDGKTGARLPTGQEDVRAEYRKGIGLSGLVQANQLTQLMTRPLGVKGVTNPQASDGAADRERLEDARRNAPLTVLTLGRIVSLQDYEDFARAFSGIEKALATWTWFGEKRGVFVTVAGSKGAEVKEKSPLHTNLLSELRRAGDPTVPLLVQSYQRRLFRLSAAVKVHPDYLPEKVLAAVEQKLRESFSFEVRQFGQPVHLSEVIAVIQNVRGVTAVDVNEFYRSDETPGSTPQPRLEAAMPQPGSDKTFAAELLTLDPRPLGLEVMA